MALESWWLGRHGSTRAGGWAVMALLELVAMILGKDSTGLTVEGGEELVHRRGDLEPGLEDHLLPLETDVLGPLHEPGEVPGRLDVRTDAEVPGALLEQGVHHALGLGALDGEGRRGHLLSLLSLLGDHLLSCRSESSNKSL